MSKIQIHYASDQNIDHLISRFESGSFYQLVEVEYRKVSALNF